MGVLFKKISSLFIIILFFLIFSGWADTWDGIKAGAVKIKSVKAEFIQEKHIKILKKPLISKGIFYYKSPGSLRWEYFSPVKSILIMGNGETRRWIKTQKGFREDHSPGLKGMGIVLDEITKWLAGNFNDNPDFKATLVPGRKILLTPKNKALLSIIAKIVLKLSDTPGIMESVTIFESEDSYTLLKFINPELNPGLDKKLFRKM